MQSVTVYFHNSRAGRLANNTIYWRCSAFDLDVSDRVIMEDNRIVCTEKGVVPHGNSISGYDWRAGRGHPSSRFWSVTRNALSRPPFEKGAEQNWVQRETLTTDGSGAFGSATVVSMSGATVHLKWLVWSTVPNIGTTLVVLDGPGRGQSRLVVGVDSSANGTLTLDSPLDGWVSSAANRGSAGHPCLSLVAVVSSFGSKIIAGNSFTWTEVVQASCALSLPPPAPSLTTSPIEPALGIFSSPLHAPVASLASRFRRLADPRARLNGVVPAFDSRRSGTATRCGESWRTTPSPTAT